MQVGSVNQAASLQSLQQARSANQLPAGGNSATQLPADSANSPTQLPADTTNGATQPPANGDISGQTQNKLSDTQKDIASTLYLGKTAETSMKIYMAVAADQTAETTGSTTWTLQPDASNNLNIIIPGANGQSQTLPYAPGSVLNTSA
ncbi:hypothetical protein [Silvimonas iriomotensis]|uniref:Uncharacterized protein n=1 Tax=Silvimonas iriomotensis TaxID=449662 RepID=A0ABQ2PDW4_9NEIS|nr:hypothetical protein [Silvimonas iriomotensis]GGP23452.1 hypothetical protein GCM10010970_34520 [Silvimonas iriomotensis]